MSEVEQSHENQPDESYEPPSVEKVDTEDSPAVTAAGQNTLVG
jgi:hypothetical protein